MNLPVVLRDEAIAEFDEAFDFYESQQAGVGVDFVLRVQQILDRISVNPNLHSAVLKDIRKAVVRRFPYCVFYLVHANRIEVIAVFHNKRAPTIWQKRV